MTDDQHKTPHTDERPETNTDDGEPGTLDKPREDEEDAEEYDGAVPDA